MSAWPLCHLFDKSSSCKIAYLFWRRHSFNLKGKDLSPSLYSKNYLFSNLSGQQSKGPYFMTIFSNEFWSFKDKPLFLMDEASTLRRFSQSHARIGIVH